MARERLRAAKTSQRDISAGRPLKLDAQDGAVRASGPRGRHSDAAECVPLSQSAAAEVARPGANSITEVLNIG